MAAVDGAGGDLDVGEVAADQFGDGEDAVAARHRDDDHLRIGGAGGAQDVEASAIAVEHLYTEALDQLDLGRIVVDQGHGVALGAQHAGDDLSETPIAEHDDRVAAVACRSAHRAAGRWALIRGTQNRSNSKISNGVGAIDSATTTVTAAGPYWR